MEVFIIVKIKNPIGKVLEVSQASWDVLYKERKGFTLYNEQEEAKKQVKEQPKEQPKKAVKKVVKRSTPKKEGEK